MLASRDLLLQAARIRLIEEKIVEIYPSDLIQSPLHLSIGQEAIAVGVCANLNAKDQIFTTYRSHAYYLAKGGDLPAFFAELMGRSTGCCKGKGGSMHLADSSVNFMGTSAIVASTLPHAVGAAYANKIKKEERLVVCIFGDGAADAGVYHESMNFAALNKLQLVFVIEDNDLAVHTRKGERQAFALEQHAKSYGFATYQLEDTHNPSDVAKLMHEVYENVKKDDKAAWVRLRAFRYREHVGVSEDFEVGYRSKEEYLTWLERDPIFSMRLTKEELEQLQWEIQNALDFAISSPFPSKLDLYKDVI